MAKIITEIPDADLDQHLEDFATQNHYPASIRNVNGETVPNPEAKIDFAARKITEFFSGSVIAAQASRRAELERKKAIDETTLKVAAITVSIVPKA